MKLTPEMYEQARRLMTNRLGLDFPESRQADLERGLIRACHAASISTPEAYLAWLATLPSESPEWRRLAGSLTVGETYFFRDRATFEALEQQVLPALIAARRTEGNPRLRLWSAGCATGEEPYSLAILLDRLLPDHPDWVMTLLATDINPEALEAARRGCYREWSFRETPTWIRERYFHRRGTETFEVDQRIRRMVTFAPLNLAEEGYPALVTNTNAMDLILCRNVLMYFTREAQRATVARLQRALLPGGWLVVSPAEASADLFRPLGPVSFSGAILYRKEERPAIRHQPSAISAPLTSWQAETVLPDPLALSPPVGVPGVSGTSSTEELTKSPADLPRPLAPVLERARPLAPVPRPLAPVPRPLAPVLERARALADQGNLEEARHLCQAVLARDRLDPEAHLLLAAICQEQGEIPAALEALRRAIYLAPDSAPAHFLLGSLLFQQGERRRGRQALKTVVRLLSGVPHNETVPGSDGLTAGRLLETAHAYLGDRDQGSGTDPQPLTPDPRLRADG